MPQRAAPPPERAADEHARRDLWPVSEAAYLLGVSPKTLYRERDRGRLVLVRVGARAYVTDKELRRYIGEREREAG